MKAKLARPTNIIVKIGEEVSDVTVNTSNGPIYSRSLDVGDKTMDKAVAGYIRRKYNLLVGDKTAEAIKSEIGSAFPLDQPLTMKIRARHLTEDEPKTIMLTDEEIRGALADCVSKLVNGVRVALERTPPEFLAEITARGILLKGSEELKKLDHRLSVETNLPVSVMHADDSPPAWRRLIHYLIIKSILEPILLSILVISFYLAAFNPYFRGWLDEANGQRVSGWVIDQSEMSARVEVQLYVDNRFVESRAADHPRPDLVAASVAEDEKHGFSFITPLLAQGEHEARVYAAHESGEGKRRTLQLIGKPIRFTVESSARGLREDAAPATGRQ